MLTSWRVETPWARAPEARSPATGRVRDGARRCWALAERHPQAGWCGYLEAVTLLLDTERWAERRRPFDRLEARVVRLHLKRPDDDLEPVVQALRYVLSFARLTKVRNAEGVDVDLAGPWPSTLPRFVRRWRSPWSAARPCGRASARCQR